MFDSASKQRATFSDEFKREALARLRSGEQTATDLVMQFGTRRNLLYKWAGKIEKQATGKQSRSKLAKAEQELEIPMKFDAYLTRLTK